MRTAFSQHSQAPGSGYLSVQLLGFLLGGPSRGEELRDSRLEPATGKLTDDIAEVLEERDIRQVAEDGEGLDDGQPPAPLVGPREEVIFSTEGGEPLLALDVRIRERD